MRIRTIGIAAALTALAMAGAMAQENYESWPLLTRQFESTGGGGIIIGEYDPVIAGGKCITDFTATTPDGTVYHNTVEYDVVEVQGGQLCTNGRWRAKDGSDSGTTPFRVFIKDGVRRMPP